MKFLHRAISRNFFSYLVLFRGEPTSDVFEGKISLLIVFWPIGAFREVDVLPFPKWQLQKRKKNVKKRKTGWKK